MARGERERDTYGRRLFRSEARAFKAQRTALLSYGIYTAVVRRSDGLYVLLHDYYAEDS